MSPEIERLVDTLMDCTRLNAEEIKDLIRSESVMVISQDIMVEIQEHIKERLDIDMERISSELIRIREFTDWSQGRIIEQINSLMTQRVGSVLLEASNEA